MTTREVKICSSCILPDTFPGITFNDDGICNFCQEAAPISAAQNNFLALREKILKAIGIKRQSAILSDYDCIVAYSGGKDSTYTLHLLVKEYGLRCLAVTIDNGFMSEQARQNCDVVTSALGVDYTILKPASNYINNMYLQSVKNPEVHVKSAIKRASNICNSCINLINIQMIRLAIQLEVSIVAGGYIGGQVPKDAAMIDMDLAILMQSRQSMQSKYSEFFGEAAMRYMQLPENLVARSNMKSILIINPMLTEYVSEDDIIRTISELGWKKTLDTGRNSSNCRLNDLGIAIHNRQYGFNPYVFEISEQVRNGLIDRKSALDKASTIPELKEVLWQAKRIGLNLDEL